MAPRPKLIFLINSKNLHIIMSCEIYLTCALDNLGLPFLWGVVFEIGFCFSLLLFFDVVEIVNLFFLMKWKL